MTTSNKLLLGLVLAVLLFITVIAGVAKYYGVQPHMKFEPTNHHEAPTPPAAPETPTPPAPPAPPVPSE